jgi:hypothetical protein
MWRLLQLTSLHLRAQERLAASYELVPMELSAIDAGWLTQNAASIDGS